MSPLLPAALLALTFASPPPSAAAAAGSTHSDAKTNTNTSTRTAAPAGAASAIEAFAVIASVLQHPRCRNCHPDGDRPLIGDPPVEHRMNVQRRLPEVGMACSSCHQLTNTPGTHKPPGAPHWGLAPREQVFQGRSPAQLCAQLRDPKTNGGRSLEQIHHHLTEDALVKWAWAPGDGREPVPVAPAELARAVRAWIDGGAACPEEKR